MARIDSEAKTVQFPLVQHAAAVGWTVMSDVDALRKRQGEGGLFFYDELRAALLRLNPGLVTEENVGDIIQRMEAVPSTIEGNREILAWLRGQRTVYDAQIKRHRNVTLVDFTDLARNTFHATYEWAFRNGLKKGNRADVMFVVNGVPVAIVENKNPKLPDAVDRAVTQLRRYELETPELMVVPQVFNVTHLLDYYYGVTWNYDRKNVFPWKEQRSETYEFAVKSFFERRAFLRLLKEWILFFTKDDDLQKTILRQHQTRAAVKIVERCADPTRKRGLIWHTQGSGKTFTLITAARLLLEDRVRFGGATVLLVVDRNELEGQLAGWVERILKEEASAGIAIEYATSRRRLQELLDADFRGLVVSMIHKFDEIRPNSCTRENVFVLIDEAHRTTGGDLGTYLMAALPNATLIGFTGTPIDKTAQGAGTFKVFGAEDHEGYLDKYSIRESVEDGTTVRLRHTLAPNSIRVPREVLDQEFMNLAAAEGVSDIEELNRILERAVRLKAFLKAEDRILRVAELVAKHFRENVEPLGYKAFLVAVDREACALYKLALDQFLPADASVAVYSKGSNDIIDRPLVAKLQIDEAREKTVRKLFTKAGEKPQILIVTDKLLTGYDAPILYCMYLDKPMRDHVLLQAVARVNRPYEDAQGVKKPCGLIIDFVGVLEQLNKALSFDSREVSGVIEDLDVLFARFREIMEGPAKGYLPSGMGTADQQLEQLLYGKLIDKDARQVFVELFVELENLYEILSPSPDLQQHLDAYHQLAALYAMVRAEYGRKAVSYASLAHKTERLLRDNATTYGLDRMTKVVEFDEAALEALRATKAPEPGSVINLVRSLRETTERDQGKEPQLLSMLERAEAVVEALEERQLSTQEAVEKLEVLMRERREAQEERTKLGLPPHAFNVYWVLRQEHFAKADQLAREIEDVFQRFPNYASSADELRQLKAEVYKVLLKVVSGVRMVALTEQLLKLPRL